MSPRQKTPRRDCRVDFNPLDGGGSICCDDRGRSVTLVGLGLIGSHLIPHLARFRDLCRVTLVDFDSYDATNFDQDILPSHCGQRKVLVQARRLRRLNAALDVVPLAERVERLPLGLLRADVIIAAVDSRAARQIINQIAWRLGCPWLDTAVDGTALQVRLSGYRPGSEAACLECRWGDDDYEALEQSYPCAGDQAATAPTRAPSALGAMAASLAAIECRKILAGDEAESLFNRELFVDARQHAYFLTSGRRNRRCRFDHGTWTLQPLACRPSVLRLRQLQALADCAAGAASPRWLRMEGFHFTRRQFCEACGECVGTHLSLAERIPPQRRQCPQCGRPLVVRGFDLLENLDLDALTPEESARTLGSVGVKGGDVICIGTPVGERYFELTVEPSLCERPRKARRNKPDFSVESLPKA